MTPKTVFAGTAIAAMVIVTTKACFAAGVVTASQAGPSPCSNVRQKTSPTGAARSTPRYERPTTRTDQSWVPSLSAYAQIHTSGGYTLAITAATTPARAPIARQAS